MSEQEQPYKYWAFISYSHQDKAWASWLHRALETYRVPRRLVGREHWSGEVPRRLLPIFRDRDELSSSAELGTVLNEALRQSRYLIVICSPQAANSRWVDEEIKTFKAMGRAARVLPIIVGGEPDVSHIVDKAASECLPPALRFEVDTRGELTDRRAEPVAADARGGQDGRRNARLKIVAGLIGVGLDELKQRERQRQMLQRAGTASLVVALTLSAVYGWRWQQTEKQQALDAHALQVRKEQLYDAGRQELLAHNEARAAVYLNEAYKLGIDTPALRFMLARALRMVDAQLMSIQTESAPLQVALSPDESRFLTVGQNSLLQIWNARNGQLLSQFQLEENADFLQAQFSAKGRWVSASTHLPAEQSVRIRIFDASSGQLVREANQGGIYRDIFADPIDDNDRWMIYVATDRSVAVESLERQQSWRLAGDYSAALFCEGRQAVVTGSESGDVAVHEFPSGRLLRRLPGLQGAVVSIDSSADCTSLTAGSAIGEVRWWGTADGALLLSSGHTQPITGLSLNAAGTRLTSTTHGGISVWQRAAGALLYDAKSFDINNATAGTSPQKTLLALNRNSRLVVTDPLLGQDLYSLDGHFGSVRSFAFGTRDSRMVSAGSDGSVVLWDLPEPLVKQLPLEQKGLRSATDRVRIEVQAAFSHAGDAYFYGGQSGAGSLRGNHAWQIEADAGEPAIRAIAFAPDDLAIAVAQRGRTLSLRDARSGAVIERWEEPTGRIQSLRFNPRGRQLAVIAQEDVLRVHLREVPGGRETARFDIDWHKAQVFSPDGRSFATGSNGLLSLWDIDRQVFLWKTALSSGAGQDARISALLFSPDGQTIVAAMEQKRAYLISAADGRVLQTLDIPLASGLYAGAYSADGQHVAFGDSSKTVFIWAPSSGQVVALLGHTAEIRSVAFSPDGALLLSAAADGVTKIWDVRRQELLESQLVQEGPVSWYNASFNADGDQIIVGGTDGAAKLIEIKSEQRKPQAIAELLSCRVAWRLNGTDLLPAQTNRCASAISAGRDPE